MLKVDIVPFEKSDISSAVFLEKKCFSEPWSENAFKSALECGNSYFFAAKCDSKFVGYAGIYVALSEGYVCNIAVDGEYRGQGIGTALTKEILNFSKKMNLDFISLEVRKSNLKAIRIYEKCGFKKVGLRKNFYRVPNEDALIMTFYFI